MSSLAIKDPDDPRLTNIRERLEKLLGGKRSALARFLIAAIGGTLPYIGSAVGAGASAAGEREQGDVNALFKAWLDIQQEEIEEIGRTLAEALIRINSQGENSADRMNSPGFQSIVKKIIREWAATDSEAKRIFIRNLLINAAAPRQITSDDVIKLFIDWIAHYSDAHFTVVRCVYRHTEGITRYRLWMEIYGQTVREDSAEADLFKLILHDLSVGHVLRLERETSGDGKFLRQTSQRRGSPSPFLKSVFDDEKPLVLTELGNQFVHYAITEDTRKLEGGPEA